MERHVCIHGHFYQPPRENPWTGAIEPQPSAAPFHDWNERITHECYARHAVCCLHGRGTPVSNNYVRMSFDFGPTLLVWLEAHAPETYRAILEADQASAAHFSGHGSAMAQAYNHLILPLASPRDRATQVRWGVADFRHRFGRLPEGMWLPETAVDLASLEALAGEGLQFAILAPHQARRVRPRDAATWTEVPAGSIDTRQAYLQALPSGRSITLFFYDGTLAGGVSFGDLLKDGRKLASALVSRFGDDSSVPGLVHLATDGETFGHHRRGGERTLALALRRLEQTPMARLTNYGEFLERHPPSHAVEIVERTAWSCAHGLGRWQDDCGCRCGSEPGWTQAWRRPLREALDGLRDDLARVFEEAAGTLLADPWSARDDFVSLLLDRSDEGAQRFFRRHARGELAAPQRARALDLLEMQRQALLMFTSCGWFFDDVAGIETMQILTHAGRALELAAGAGDADPALAARFEARLAQARSNRADRGSGREVYRAAVQAARAAATGST